MKRIYLAPTGFEKELAAELSDRVLEKHGRLFLAEAPIEPVVWAQNIWLEPRSLEIASISDGSRQLKSASPFWTLHSEKLHRRASLIQEKLPRVSQKPLRFPDSPTPQPARELGAWTLIEPSRIWASAKTSSRFADGVPVFEEDKTAPSRAYLKLWELFLSEGFHPQKGERCLDLGASPGGWTWVLAKLGCDVMAVDRSPLREDVAALGNVRSLSGNAFTFKPEDLVERAGGPFDWLFSDVICYPEQLLELVERWLRSGLCRNFVCTIKFKGETDFKMTRKFAAIPGSRLKHLSVNKHELTWFNVRP